MLRNLLLKKTVSRKLYFFLIMLALGQLSRLILLEPLPGFLFSLKRYVALVVSARLGPLPGLFVLASLSFDVGNLTGNYYPLIVISAEVIFIGIVRRRKPEASILAADALYWPLFGVPLLFFLYSAGHIASTEVLVLIVIKAWLNGIYDAYLASIIDELRITDILLGFSKLRKRNLLRYLGTRFSFLFLPFLLIGMFVILGFIGSQSSLQIGLRIEHALALGAAEVGTAEDRNLMNRLEAINPYPEGRYLFDYPEESKELSESQILEENIFYRYETTREHPLEQWRRREFFGILKSFPQITYVIPFESEFQHLYAIYSKLILSFIFLLYGIACTGFVSIWFFSRRINRLTGEARKLPERIKRGDHIVWPVMDIRELDTLSSEFQDVSVILRDHFRNLRDTNRQLEREVSRRTQDLQRLTRELRLLLNRRENQQETERIRLARELHDEFGQNITGLRMGLFLLEGKLAKNENPAVMRKIQEMKELLVHLSSEMHRIVADLRPAVLDKLGLCEALKQLTEKISKQSDVSVDFECTIPQSILSNEELKTAVYRIAQEAVSNAVHHSGTSRIALRLRTEEKNLIVEIEDFGSGMVNEEMTGREGRVSFGLIGMRERCSALGGSFELRSSPGKGTLLRAVLPFS